MPMQSCVGWLATRQIKESRTSVVFLLATPTQTWMSRADKSNERLFAPCVTLPNLLLGHRLFLNT